MKMYLLMKHTIKENYKYLLTMLMAYGFLGVIYHITNNEVVQNYGIQVVAFGLSLVNALILPSILYKNYYNVTNSNHVASIPMKRIEVFFSLYLVGLGVSLALILGYSCFTELFYHSVDAFVGYSSALLIGFVYYYHLSLLAFWICGHGLFQSVVTLVMIFGPFIGFMVYEWALEMYDSTYMFTYTNETLMNLLPVYGCLSYWLEYDPTRVYGLYLIITLILLVLTIIIVRYRRYEKTGQSMVFNSLSYVVRAIIILLGGACLYAIFGSILGEREYIAQFMTCMILSIMVAYVVEMIYKKKTKVFYSIATGVLSAIVIFSSITLGVKAMDSYIPSNYAQIILEVNNYYYHYSSETGKVVIEDQALCQKVVEMNKKIMDEYYEAYESYGSIVIQYCEEDGDPFFARNYRLSQEVMESICNDPEYKEIVLDVLTSRENQLLKLVQNKQVVNIYLNEVEGVVYTIDTDAEFYLFENYLKQELDALANRGIYADIEQDSEFYHYLTYEYVDENGNKQSEYMHSGLIYNALSKTFDF